MNTNKHKYASFPRSRQLLLHCSTTHHPWCNAWECITHRSSGARRRASLAAFPRWSMGAISAFDSSLFVSIRGSVFWRVCISFPRSPWERLLYRSSGTGRIASLAALPRWSMGTISAFDSSSFVSIRGSVFWRGCISFPQSPWECLMHRSSGAGRRASYSYIPTLEHGNDKVLLKSIRGSKS